MTEEINALTICPLLSKNIKGKMANFSCKVETSSSTVSFECTNFELIRTGIIALTMSEDDSYVTDIFKDYLFILSTELNFKY